MPPKRYIRFIYNRLILENALVRAAAVVGTWIFFAEARAACGGAQQRGLPVDGWLDQAAQWMESSGFFSST